jgi:hypothetical protein
MSWRKEEIVRFSMASVVYDLVSYLVRMLSEMFQGHRGSPELSSMSSPIANNSTSPFAPASYNGG